VLVEGGCTMDENVKRALQSAYEGEAKAALRLKVYADKAEKEGYQQIAKLFRVIAYSEEIHGSRALRTLREIGSTEENLVASFESEISVAHVAYDQFIKKALEAEDKAAALHFTQSRDVASEQDPLYYVCSVCGYVSDDVLPDVCPVCGAKKDRFVEFDG